MQSYGWPKVLLVLCILFNTQLHAQDSSKISAKSKHILNENYEGWVSFGARNDVSLFAAAPKSPGVGAGGSMRLQLLSRLNTEWFSDYITSNPYNKAHRVDAHIGWNVMYYVLDPHGFTRKFTPFLAAGQCFDYTSVQLNGENQPKSKKWTAALQMELGCHYNITPRFDVSLSTLYDLHLGKDLETIQNSDGSVTVTDLKAAGWEGHVMIILSAHYKIYKLWNRKKKQA